MAKATVREVPGKGATAPKVKPDPIKVRALELCYYDHVRRREGDVFLIEAADLTEKVRRYLVEVPPDTPEQVTTAQQALKQAHVDTLTQAARPATGTDRDVLG